MGSGSFLFECKTLGELQCDSSPNVLHFCWCKEQIGMPRLIGTVI